ncbi:MAG TPA: hypothetical protein VES96_05290 [Nitrospiraceae bacterium]|nr:hypothetical protein [Nitrospiraceae bacterium]
MEAEQKPETEAPSGPYEEGKRAGAHPLVVVLSIILGLWFVIWLATPKGKQTQAPVNPELASNTIADDETAAAPIMFRVKVTVKEFNAISVLVPEQATDSQVAGLLKRFRQARLANQLATLLPPTTPKHKLGEHAVADIFIFSDGKFAKADALGVLSRGAHAPGELYPSAVPFETAMEHVRGHYRIDLNDTGHPDKGSIGFADESGIHSKHYRALF